MASINDKLEKVRKPRVHIKYEVETEGATELKELPFTVGVMGDFAGNNPGVEAKNIKDRKFINIDPDNFDEVMMRIQPGIKTRVENMLEENGSELAIDLQFRSIEDFEPTQIVEQVDALKKLKQIRDKLRDLLSKADRSDKLEEILENALQNPSQLKQLAKELAID